MKYNDRVVDAFPPIPVVPGGTNIVASRGDPIQIDYRLEKVDTGWKIYDVNILGVWLVENYKTQFASEINANGVDGLIKTLTERNRQLEQGKKI